VAHVNLERTGELHYIFHADVRFPQSILAVTGLFIFGPLGGRNDWGFSLGKNNLEHHVGFSG